MLILVFLTKEEAQITAAYPTVALKPLNITAAAATSTQSQLQKKNNNIKKTTSDQITYHGASISSKAGMGQ